MCFSKTSTVAIDKVEIIQRSGAINWILAQKKLFVMAQTTIYYSSDNHMLLLGTTIAPHVIFNAQGLSENMEFLSATL